MVRMTHKNGGRTAAACGDRVMAAGAKEIAEVEAMASLIVANWIKHFNRHLSNTLKSEALEDCLDFWYAISNRKVIMSRILSFFAWCLLASAHLSANEEYAFCGKHFIASYSGCNQEALNDYRRLEEVMLEAARASGATILNSSKHVFSPNGLTMVILISESHASIHTYPEFQSCFVDLFTCGDRCSSDRFDQVLRDYLTPEKVSTHSLIRHDDIEEIK